MHQHGVWDINVPQACFFKFQAKVHVVKCDRERILIETPDGLKLAFFDNQACRRDCANELGGVRLTKIAGLVSRKKAVRVPRSISDTDHDTSVLDRAVLIEEFG